MSHRSPPTPSQLFRLYELGKIGRNELLAAIDAYARFLLIEIQESRRLGPAAALEDALNRREAEKLAKEHGEEILREAFAALSDIPDFPPSGFLWNARHNDVPFHCFLRSRREPMFRIIHFHPLPMMITIDVEHGGGKSHPRLRERFTLRRDRRGELHVESRRAI